MIGSAQWVQPRKPCMHPRELHYSTSAMLGRKPQEIASSTRWRSLAGNFQPIHGKGCLLWPPATNGNTLLAQDRGHPSSLPIQATAVDDRNAPHPFGSRSPRGHLTALRGRELPIVYSKPIQEGEHKTIYLKMSNLRCEFGELGLRDRSGKSNGSCLSFNCGIDLDHF